MIPGKCNGECQSFNEKSILPEMRMRVSSICFASCALQLGAGGRMTTLDWSQCPVIESDPDKHSGDWVFKNTRLPVSTILQCLADNASIDDLIDWYAADPGQIREFLNFIAMNLEQTANRAHLVRR